MTAELWQSTEGKYSRGADEHNADKHPVDESREPASEPVTWSRRRGEFGRLVRVFDSSVGVYTIDGNGAGTMKWTVTYPDGDTGLTDTMREAVAWAENHYARRTGTAPELGE